MSSVLPSTSHAPSSVGRFFSDNNELPPEIVADMFSYCMELHHLATLNRYCNSIIHKRCTKRAIGTFGYGVVDGYEQDWSWFCGEVVKSQSLLKHSDGLNVRLALKRTKLKTIPITLANLHRLMLTCESKTLTDRQIATAFKLFTVEEYQANNLLVSRVPSLETISVKGGRSSCISLGLLPYFNRYSTPHLQKVSFDGSVCGGSKLTSQEEAVFRDFLHSAPSSLTELQVVGSPSVLRMLAVETTGSVRKVVIDLVSYNQRGEELLQLLAPEDQRFVVSKGKQSDDDDAMISSVDDLPCKLQSPSLFLANLQEVVVEGGVLSSYYLYIFPLMPTLQHLHLAFKYAPNKMDIMQWGRKGALFPALRTLWLVVEAPAFFQPPVTDSMASTLESLILIAGVNPSHTFIPFETQHFQYFLEKTKHLHTIQLIMWPLTPEQIAIGKAWAADTAASTDGNMQKRSFKYSLNPHMEHGSNDEDGGDDEEYEDDDSACGGDDPSSDSDAETGELRVDRTIGKTYANFGTGEVYVFNEARRLREEAVATRIQSRLAEQVSNAIIEEEEEAGREVRWLH